MKRVDSIRNGIIDKILAIRSRDFLIALDGLLASSKNEDVVELTSDQKIMLQMGDRDIANGDLYSEEDIQKEDDEWLTGK